MVEPLSVLIVCRANVCRSPLAAHLMERYATAAGLGDVIAVRAAGTDVVTEVTSCREADEWVGVKDGHRATRLSVAHLGAADLILAADRENRSACAMLDPACRTRLFTLRQAAHLAGAVAAGPPPVSDPARRLLWLVGEWDAARVLLSGRDEQSDDIVDRHGPQEHADVFEELDSAVRAIVAAFDRYASGAPI